MNHALSHTDMLRINVLFASFRPYQESGHFPAYLLHLRRSILRKNLSSQQQSSGLH
jgi:hypothetical protein